MSKIKKKDLWESAWRSAVTVTIISVVAYLAAGYGWNQGRNDGYQARDVEAQAQVRTAYEFGKRDGSTTCQRMFYEEPTI